MKLQDKKCNCASGEVQKLSTEGIEDLLKQVQGWKVVDGHHLQKEYEFKKFPDQQFVNQLIDIANEQKHHPDIYLTWGKARIEIYTHVVDTSNDEKYLLFQAGKNSAPLTFVMGLYASSDGGYGFNGGIHLISMECEKEGFPTLEALVKGIREALPEASDGYSGMQVVPLFYVDDEDADEENEAEPESDKMLKAALDTCFNNVSYNRALTKSERRTFEQLFYGN